MMQRPEDFKSKVSEIRAWRFKLANKPAEALAVMQDTARKMAKADRTDPFTFNRVMSEMKLAISVPEDFADSIKHVTV
jgi:hypothetical protein